MAPERMRRVPGWVTATSCALSMLAVGLTAYLTVTHYTDPTALACPDTGIVNCTAVTTSSWSVIAGVPVADLHAEMGWYERLFGRPADIVPNDNEAMWCVAGRW